jgi:hypothetical protein
MKNKTDAVSINLKNILLLYLAFYIYILGIYCPFFHLLSWNNVDVFICLYSLTCMKTFYDQTKLNKISVTLSLV